MIPLIMSPSRLSSGPRPKPTLTREILVPEKLNLKPLTPTFTPVCPFVQGEMLAVALTPTSALTVALALPEGSMLTPQAFADAPAEPVAPSDAAPALPPIDADACGGERVPSNEVMPMELTDTDLRPVMSLMVAW